MKEVFIPDVEGVDDGGGGPGGGEHGRKRDGEAHVNTFVVTETREELAEIFFPRSQLNTEASHGRSFPREREKIRHLRAERSGASGIFLLL